MPVEERRGLAFITAEALDGELQRRSAKRIAIDLRRTVLTLFCSCFPARVSRGEVTNGGFGLVLIGDADSAARVRLMLPYDVNNGVARRAWAGNENASLAIKRSMQDNPLLRVTEAHFADDDVLEKAVASSQ